jgi:hypothetical protein
VTECQIDGRPAPDAVLCRGCLDALKAELRSVAWLVEQLGVTLTRQARVGQRNGPRSAETPLPFHLAASTDLESLADELDMWARAVAKQRGIEVDAAREPVALARWLLRWAGEVAQFPDAAELHAGVLSMTEAARRTVDLPPQKRYVGPCEDCGNDLYVPALGSGTPRFVRCAARVERDGDVEACGAEYPLEARRAWLLEQAYDRLLTASEMSRAIRELAPGKPISRNLISQWGARGRIARYLPHPRDPHGHTRYRVEDVIIVARGENESQSATA